MLVELWVVTGSLSALDSRTVHNGLVFNGVDQIDRAISDVADTSAVLDEMIANMSDGDTKHGGPSTIVSPL